jgi:tetratricopeptide (TPR) repeat protein
MSFDTAFSQETVFALLKSDKRRADEYFREKNFENALRYYSNVSKGRRFNAAIVLQIAETSFHLKKYKQAVDAYERYLKSNATLPKNSLFQLAESWACLGDYTKAMNYYRQYLQENGEDPIILKKVWRINNLKFLLEDSAHFAVRPLTINSKESELLIKPFQKRYLFLSNRKILRVVEKLDASTSKQFYSLYSTSAIPDSTMSAAVRLSKPVMYKASFKFHTGPFAFYLHETRMVVTKLGSQSRLVFAEKKGNEWKIISEFPFNSDSYSLTDPSMNEAGTVLYFSSDMNGGFGGKDLYRSILVNGEWTKPINLGDVINTPYNEVSPYLHRNTTLYFSSDGQPGMGGLDMFKSEILSDGFDEPKNLGYPLNSRLDDFNVTLDSTSRKGLFTSNRDAGEFNDDLFGFEMDLQPYPLVINGTLRYKEHNWNDSSVLKSFGNAKLFVIDAIRNVVVFEQTTDKDGKFSITIPHFSMYKIRVIGEDQHENIVSLVLPKYLKEQSDHDIVVIKDAFKVPDNN